MTTTETKEEAKQNATDAEVELSPEEQTKRNKLVTFVANNILNSITLNQAVTVIQQVALKDAHAIIDDADDVKLKEIEAAMITAENTPAEEGGAAGEVTESDGSDDES